MKSKLIILLIFPLIGYAQYFKRVPNTTTFTLQNVVDVVAPSSNDLNECFNDGDINGFNATYKANYYSEYGNRNNLMMFRDYCQRPPTFNNSIILNYSMSLYAGGTQVWFNSSLPDAWTAAKKFYWKILQGYNPWLSGVIRYHRTLDIGDTLLLNSTGCTVSSSTGFYLTNNLIGNPLAIVHTTSPTITNIYPAPHYDHILASIGTGIWYCPAGVDTIIVECIGGGGAGGGARGNPSAGGGGAGGTYTVGWYAVTPGNTYNYGVGAGGTGSTGNGGAGGTTWFISSDPTVGTVALGGEGGKEAAANNSVGSGGVGTLSGSAGIYPAPGGDGSAGFLSILISHSGAGGSSGRRYYESMNNIDADAFLGGVSLVFPTSYGANGQTANSVAGLTPTQGYGGGGSGGKANNNTDRAGGNGRQGVILIHYF